MARVERHKLIEEAEPELVRLAFGIAERVLHQQVALDRGVAVEMAKVAIARLIERDTVTVRVNPADLERMREHRDELIAIGDIRNLRVVEDKRVDRGGVVVDSAAGTIDARIRRSSTRRAKSCTSTTTWWSSRRRPTTRSSKPALHRGAGIVTLLRPRRAGSTRRARSTICSTPT